MRTFSFCQLCCHLVSCHILFHQVSPSQFCSASIPLPVQCHMQHCSRGILFIHFNLCSLRNSDICCMGACFSRDPNPSQHAHFSRVRPLLFLLANCPTFWSLCHSTHYSHLVQAVALRHPPPFYPVLVISLLQTSLVRVTPDVVHPPHSWSSFCLRTSHSHLHRLLHLIIPAQNVFMPAQPRFLCHVFHSPNLPRLVPSFISVPWYNTLHPPHTSLYTLVLNHELAAVPNGERCNWFSVK